MDKYVRTVRIINTPSETARYLYSYNDNSKVSIYVSKNVMLNINDLQSTSYYNNNRTFSLLLRKLCHGEIKFLSSACVVSTLCFL